MVKGFVFLRSISNLLNSHHNATQNDSLKRFSFLQSTAVRIILLIIALLMPFNVVTILLIRMTVNNVQEQVEKEIQNALDMNVFNFTQQLRNVSRRKIYMCVNSENSEFQEFSTLLDSYSSVKKGL